MAARPVFVALADARRPYTQSFVTFQWFPGFSVSQKQKSIDSLHAAARQALRVERILEISSKSRDDVGVRLSAFNLSLALPDGKSCSVESAYQGSKVTECGGPYTDIYLMTAREAKRDERVKAHRLKGFRYFDTDWPLVPASLFYDCLYITALCQESNASLLKELVQYDAFTDIEFNPTRQIACQARSAAIQCGLTRSGVEIGTFSDLDCLTRLLQTL